MKDIMRTVESDSERDGDDSESDVKSDVACVSDSLFSCEGGCKAAAAARSSRARLAATVACAALARCESLLFFGGMITNCRCRRSSE